MDTNCIPEETYLQEDFEGYIVDLEVYEDDGEVRSDCMITSPCGKFTSSLALACDLGVLEDGDEQHVISQSLVKKIEDWAINNGY
jgi:hypothetical protein